MNPPDNTATAAALEEARTQLRQPECGGQSTFRSKYEGMAEIRRLRELKRTEDRYWYTARREEIRTEMVEADIAMDVARAAESEARAQYRRLKEEAASIAQRLRMEDQRQAVEYMA